MQRCGAQQRPRIEGTIVEVGTVTEVFVTGVLPIEMHPHFARITFVSDHPWGGPNGPERHVRVHTVLTPECLDELEAQIATARRRLGSH